jgi:hypothetical protein
MTTRSLYPSGQPSQLAEGRQSPFAGNSALFETSNPSVLPVGQTIKPSLTNHTQARPTLA